MANERIELLTNLKYLADNWHKIPSRFRGWRGTGITLSFNLRFDGESIITHNGKGKHLNYTNLKDYNYKRFDNKTAHIINKTVIYNYLLLLKQASNEKVSAQDIAEITNTDIRNYMITEFGLEKFFKVMGARLVHKSKKNRLLKLKVKDEEITMVEVKDASTDKIYLLRVPPDMRNADEAVAWTFGMSAKEYKPIRET